MIRRVTLDNKIFIFFKTISKKIFRSPKFFVVFYGKYQNFIIQSDPSDHFSFYEKNIFVIKNMHFLIAPNFLSAGSCTTV